MCISVPAKVCAVSANQAEVEANGCRRKVLVAVDGVQVGGWVLVHGGIVIATMTTVEAEESLRLLAMLTDKVQTRERPRLDAAADNSQGG